MAGYDNDNIDVSMAQQALTGVNKGMGILAPEVKVSDKIGVSVGGDKLKSQVQSAYDIAKQTVSGLSRGLLRGSRGMFDPNIKSPFFDSGVQRTPQRSDLAGKNSSELLAEFLVQQAILKQQNQGVGVDRTRNASIASRSTAILPEIDTRPLSERVAMMRPVGGGAIIPHYDYNGISVALPDGVDMNDANAVGAAMTEQNALIDMMDSFNDDEED